MDPVRCRRRRARAETLMGPLDALALTGRPRPERGSHAGFLRLDACSGAKIRPTAVVFWDPLKGTLTQAESHMCPFPSDQSLPATPTGFRTPRPVRPYSRWSVRRWVWMSGLASVAAVRSRRRLRRARSDVIARLHGAQTTTSALVVARTHRRPPPRRRRPPPPRPRPRLRPRPGPRPGRPGRDRRRRRRPPQLSLPTATPRRGAAPQRWPTSRPMRLRASPSIAPDTPRATRP